MFRISHYHLRRALLRTMVGAPSLSPWGYHLLLHPALEALSSLSVQDASSDVFSTPPQLDGELITLTLLPRSRWQTLLNLEVIQQRNKPKEPPKPIEKAPFFLPTLPGVETRFTMQRRNQKETKKVDAQAG